MEKIYFDGARESGALVLNAVVVLPEGWGMSQLVRAIKEAGYVSFMTRTMKRFVKI